MNTVDEDRGLASELMVGYPKLTTQVLAQSVTGRPFQSIQFLDQDHGAGPPSSRETSLDCGRDKRGEFGSRGRGHHDLAPSVGVGTGRDRIEIKRHGVNAPAGHSRENGEA